MNTPGSTSLDVRVVLDTTLRQFVPWLAAVLLVTLAGYPGVVCVTPLAWLITLRVGLLVAIRSRSVSSKVRILEAALAGALYGILQGVLFFVIIGRAGEIQPDEQTNAMLLNTGMTVVGMIAGAGLSALNAWLYETRRSRQAT